LAIRFARGLSQLILKEWQLDFLTHFFLIFFERGTSERNNRKQITATLSARQTDAIFPGVQNLLMCQQHLKNSLTCGV
jgi:hypothetical protein